MNDKVKGLILGALLGSAITGTAAYASGVQIEVFFRPLTYLFDGVEKTPTEGSGFIYEGSTYVPIRFVSEALGKEVGWDEATGTITVDEPGFNQVVAVYKDNGQEVRLTQSMVAKRAAIARLLNPSYDQYADDPSFLSHMQLEAASSLIASLRVDEAARQAAQDSAADELEGLKLEFEQVFQGQPSWDSRLQQLKLSEADVEEYWRQYSIREAYLRQSASEDAIAQAYAAANTSHEFDTATVRHILVGFTDAEGNTRSNEEALTRAQEVEALLKDGKSFDELALEYSDDPGSSSNGGLYENVQVANWVEGFKNAVLQQQAGEIGEPVETEYGYHVILVESLTVPDLESLRSTLTERLMNEAYQQLLQVELPALQQPLE